MKSPMKYLKIIIFNSMSVMFINEITFIFFSQLKII
jgi:hypothetical protein